MGKLTKEQLAEQAEGYFEKYPNSNTFFATSDGMFFTQDNRAYAVDHAMAGNHDMYTLTRPRENDEAVEDPTRSTPDMKWTKEMLQNFLTVKGIEFAENETKSQLLDKINQED